MARIKGEFNKYVYEYFKEKYNIKINDDYILKKFVELYIRNSTQLINSYTEYNERELIKILLDFKLLNGTNEKFERGNLDFGKVCKEVCNNNSFIDILKPYFKEGSSIKNTIFNMKELRNKLTHNHFLYFKKTSDAIDKKINSFIDLIDIDQVSSLLNDTLFFNPEASDSNFVTQKEKFEIDKYKILSNMITNMITEDELRELECPLLLSEIRKIIYDK